MPFYWVMEIMAPAGLEMKVTGQLLLLTMEAQLERVAMTLPGKLVW